MDNSQASVKRVNKGGRNPKSDPCNNRYVFYLNDVDKQKLNSMFLQSEMKEMSRFLKVVIFNKPIKVVKIDKSTLDYYIRLTNLYSQFQSVGVNYNQTVKAIHTNFSEKRAAILLQKLEKATFELVKINQQMIKLTQEYEVKWLQK